MFLRRKAGKTAAAMVLQKGMNDHTQKDNIFSGERQESRRRGSVLLGQHPCWRSFPSDRRIPEAKRNPHPAIILSVLKQNGPPGVI